MKILELWYQSEVPNAPKDPQDSANSTVANGFQLTPAKCTEKADGLLPPARFVPCPAARIQACRYLAYSSQGCTQAQMKRCVTLKQKTRTERMTVKS